MDSFNNDSATKLQKQTKINPPKETTISTATCNEPIEHKTENLSEIDVNEISIKLKFINDDQKMVTGSLKELLGDFKRLLLFNRLSMFNKYLQMKYMYNDLLYFSGGIFKRNLMHKN